MNRGINYCCFKKEPLPWSRLYSGEKKGPKHIWFPGWDNVEDHRWACRTNPNEKNLELRDYELWVSKTRKDKSKAEFETNGIKLKSFKKWMEDSMETVKRNPDVHQWCKRVEQFDWYELGKGRKWVAEAEQEEPRWQILLFSCFA